MSDNMTCEFPDSNPLDDEVRGLLESAKTIAVVGLSNKPERDSYKVADYLLQHGYTVIPVNPVLDEVLGLKSYPDLKSIPQPVDIVDIFRKVEFIPGLVDDAIDIEAKAVWMQLGLASNAAAQKARDAGLQVVQSKCIKIEHKKLMD